MQSYASPGRVITVANIGTDAVAVRADQPYRLGNLVGVTDAPAGVGDDLNLCVEGVFEQTVALADGVAAAEAGDPVLMNVWTFALVAGLTDTTDHVPFGVLAERMTRRRVALVKLTPALAAAPASGSGDGGSGGGSSGGREVLVLSNVRVGPNYYENPEYGYVWSSYGYDGQDLQGQNLFAKTDGMTWPATRLPTGTDSKSYIQVENDGLYRVTVAGRIPSGVVPAGTGIGIRVESYNAEGQPVGNVWLTKASHIDGFMPGNYQESCIHRFTSFETAGVRKHFRFQDEIYLQSGWKIGIRVLAYAASDNTGGVFRLGWYDYDVSDPAQRVEAFDASPSIMVEKIL
jgi:hypothetical protein